LGTSEVTAQDTCGGDREADDRGSRYSRPHAARSETADDDQRDAPERGEEVRAHARPRRPAEVGEDQQRHGAKDHERRQRRSDAQATGAREKKRHEHGRSQSAAQTDAPRIVDGLPDPRNHAP
jgi:hypothetical protein